MIKFDSQLLDDLGLSSLSSGEKDELLKYLYELLQLRVGLHIADRLSAAELTELDQLMSSADQAEGRRFIEDHAPDREALVQEEWSVLREEVAAVAPRLLAVAAAVPWPPDAGAS